jgi:hypothetical protein
MTPIASYSSKQEPVGRSKRTVFLNMAYGRESQKFLVAYVAGLASLGLVPKMALEVPASGRRLDHIQDLVRNCAFSLHDLRHVTAQRWNMILELGIAVGTERTRSWFVLDYEPYRAMRTLSDLNGTDVYGHRGTPNGVLAALLNIFSRPGQGLSVAVLKRVYHHLEKQAGRIMNQEHAESVFERRVFQRLAKEASRFVQERVVHRESKRQRPSPTSVG